MNEKTKRDIMNDFKKVTGGDGAHFVGHMEMIEAMVHFVKESWPGDCEVSIMLHPRQTPSDPPMLMTSLRTGVDGVAKSLEILRKCPTASAFGCEEVN